MYPPCITITSENVTNTANVQDGFYIKTVLVYSN